MVTIASTKKASPQEWDEIWKNCDYATYFHSRDWAEIWQGYNKGNTYPEPILISFSDGKEALLPFSCSKSCKGLLKTYISSPAGTYGGWISSDSIEEPHAEVLKDYIIQNFNNLTWRVNPYDKFALKIRIDNVKEDETHSIPLKDDFDKIYKMWSKGHYSAVKQAVRKGVIVKVASSINDWKSYYEVYKDTLERWGDKATSSYKWSLFENIFNRSSKNIKLWLALCDEKIIAGALCFYAKKHIVYWHGAALKDYFKARPVNLLMYEAIKDACERGYLWFDFNPSGGHEGVKAFKKSFTAEPLSCPIIKKESKICSLVGKIAKSLKK